MKQHLDGLSGKEEYLALKALVKTPTKTNPNDAEPSQDEGGDWIERVASGYEQRLITEAERR